MAENKRPTSLPYKPLYPILMNSSFQRNDIRARNEGIQREKFIAGTVSIYSSGSDDFRLASCEFSAGEELKSEADQEKEEPFFEVKAEYIIAVRFSGRVPNDEEMILLFTDVAATSAWPLFRSHFAMVTAQAITELPPLPLVPDFIDASIVEGEPDEE